MSLVEPKKGVAFFCLGGAYNGAFGAGVLQGFWDNDFTPSYMQLSSVGALNGLQPLGGPKNSRLYDIWLEIENRGPDFIFRLWGAAFNWRHSHLFGTKGLKALIDTLDIEKIFNSPVTVEVVAKDDEFAFFKNRYASRQKVKERENFYKSIFATTALQGVFPPVLINGRWYSDPLIIDLNRAPAHNCKHIYVISNEHDNLASPEPQNEWWLNRIGQILTTTLYGWIYEKIVVFQLVHPECQVTIIKPTKSLPNLSTFYFKKGAIKEALDHGYNLATKIAKSRPD